MAGVALARIQVDTDVAGTLPGGDRVVADAMHLFDHHPVKDQIAVDIGLPRGDRARLVVLARQVEAALDASGLFARVGLARIQNHLPELVHHVDRHLPLLLSARDLEEEVAPHLERDRIARRLDALRTSLQGIEGIGQGRSIAHDPLGLNQILLARLVHLAPSRGGTLVEGRLVSADGRHLLIPAAPLGSGTDTTFARRLTHLMADLEAGLKTQGPVTLTAVGAFRAALDNETILRRDVNQAIAWATAGIAVLLLLAFSRPLVGLLALLPALAGAATALLVFALGAGHISILVLGFGGAVISISVDHGIAYLLFLEQSPGDRRQAARDIRSVGLLAVLTSVGAFGLLGLSDFPIFAQLGRFTAVGIGAAFVFVHTVMPRLFVPEQGAPPAAEGGRPEPGIPLLRRLAHRLPNPGPWGAAAAGALLLCLAGFAQMRLDTRLERMNSLSTATRDAEAVMAQVWGSLFDRVYLMAEAADPETLQRSGDALLERLEAEAAAARVSTVVSAASFFPGPRRQAANRSAWCAFWTPQRVAALRSELIPAAEARGFRPEAFDPFFQRLTAPPPAAPLPVPAGLGELLGFGRDRNDGRWRQVAWLLPGPNYDAAGLFERLGQEVRIFDPPYFSQRLGRLLSTTVQHLMIWIGVGMVVLLLVFLADLGLVAIALLPLVFAGGCTLGTLGLMGRPLDMAALMLGVVILGLGIDYALLLVGAFQRYQRLDHPRLAQVRLAILLAGGSTLMGFAVLAGADHTVLQSAGITSALGIGYGLLGTFLIVPPMLERRSLPPGPGPRKAWHRYRNQAPRPRLAARLVLGFDPRLNELDALLAETGPLSTIIDVRCGWGLVASRLLERHPRAGVWAQDPDPERVRVAGLALAPDGVVARGAAPEVPTPPHPAQLALMLDVAQRLDDPQLGRILSRLHRRLAADGRLVMRCAAARDLPAPVQKAPRKPPGRSPRTLDRLLRQNGFVPEKTVVAGRRRQRVWILARPALGPQSVQWPAGTLRQQSGSEAR